MRLNMEDMEMSSGDLFSMVFWFLVIVVVLAVYFISASYDGTIRNEMFLEGSAFCDSFFPNANHVEFVRNGNKCMVVMDNSIKYYDLEWFDGNFYFS